ncbi:proline--tRNA ligase [Clostridium sp. CAG:628]|jgi:prolyl-tRNA synthetase|nr:proline--tRNA ligase [Clostridium sp. CAG:628]
MKNNKITSRDVDFAKWYNDVVESARLARYSNVKGCIIFEPNGCALWESIKENMDKLFKETGHKNIMMPMFIPENLLRKEGELVNGFAPEVAWVTIGGSKPLEEKLAVRPTSETLFSDYFHEVVKSYRDLPLKLNQWCSVVRWEKETRPFLRSREFFWQEGHTVHATSEEAEKETRDMLNIYIKFFTEYLAVPVVSGKKTEKEKFAGAEYTLTIEALMHNGVCLQSGTSHYFGQKFSEAYDIKFLNKDNKQEYAYQTSWGTSNRMIGAVIMVHGDDYGLVLPPKIAPIKVDIIPIGNDILTSSEIEIIKSKLSENNITFKVDDSDKTPGFKFAESEVNGTPIRIEIGKRDLENKKVTLVRRDTREKISVDINEVIDKVKFLLTDIQDNLYNKALERMNALTFEASTMSEMESIIKEHPGFIKADWCGRSECEVKLKDKTSIKSRCILENEKLITGKCAICGKPAKELVIWGIQY